MDQCHSYTNVNSNHPKTIIKQVPKAVNLRIKNSSANKKIFQESSEIYMDARKNFTFKEENIPHDINKEKDKEYGRKNRKRKIIWFNPHFVD